MHLLPGVCSVYAMKRSGFKKPFLDVNSRIVRRRRAALKAGKKSYANKRANATLAKEFKGEPYCEARFPHDCTRDRFLTWAHNAKRRKNPDLLHAALLCQNAHNCIEYLPPEEMKMIVDGIIKQRRLAA